jgi:hypothetical protein
MSRRLSSKLSGDISYDRWYGGKAPVIELFDMRQ